MVSLKTSCGGNQCGTLSIQRCWQVRIEGNNDLEASRTAASQTKYILKPCQWCVNTKRQQTYGSFEDLIQVCLQMMLCEVNQSNLRIVREQTICNRPEQRIDSVRLNALHVENIFILLPPQKIMPIWEASQIEIRRSSSPALNESEIQKFSSYSGIIQDSLGV